jgi:CO/xanthine dehydrogenase FAD-binding subunit
LTYTRRLPRFEYLAPRTPEDVCELLASHPDDARLLAGGTELLLQMRRRETVPGFIIGLKSVPGLNYIREQTGGGLSIGAMTPIQSLLTSQPIRARFGILSETAAQMGSPEIRQLATLGGNLAAALPCADFPPALMTLGAKLKLQSKQGERSVAVEDFFLEFGKTAAGRDELLSEIQLPPLPPLSAGVYLKFHDRHSMDMTTVGVAAQVTCDDNRRVFRDVRIALASSAPVPLRARKAETSLRGRAFTPEALEEAASLVCEEAAPRSSWRATKAFRMQLLRTLTKRTLRGAWEKALARSNGGRS